MKLYNNFQLKKLKYKHIIYINNNIFYFKMDASKAILTLIKDDQIKKNLNPLVYYALKLMYNPEFASRSRYFGMAIKRLYDELGHNLQLQILTLDENILKAENTMTFDMSVVYDVNMNETNQDEDPLNVSANKDTYRSVNKLMKKNWMECFNLMVDYDDDYILDRDDDEYILLKLIKDYITSDIPPAQSSLMICYKIFCSSIELMFCFKLVLSFPSYLFMKKEKEQIDEYFENIKYRVSLFLDAWCATHWETYQKNKLIKEIIGPKDVKPEIEPEKKEKKINIITMSEPILNTKYVSFTNLIKEGPFCLDIEEIARQFCLIDHEMLCELHYNDFIQFLVKKEIPKIFKQFIIREKRLKCYILIYMSMHGNLENKKNMIQNFIALAAELKRLNNQQTCDTIINTFSILGITKKKLLWKLIEKKYRDTFSDLEKELNNVELNENTIFNKKQEEGVGCVPHIKYIIGVINNLIIQMKGMEEKHKIFICNDFKGLIEKMDEISKEKYLFFKVNPLYDFLKFGFLEIFKPKKWGLKSRFDFSGYTRSLTKLDQLLNYLVKSFQKSDNY